MAYLLGKHEYIYDVKHLHLNAYLKRPSLPTAPSIKKYSDAIGVENLGEMLNSKLGICTVAGRGHQIQLWTANTGTLYTPPDADLQKVYSEITGYDPNDPNTDQGAKESDVLDYCKKTGICGHKILGYVHIGIHDHNNIIQCANLFGGLYIGIQLPQTAQQQINNNLPWNFVSRRNTGKPGSWGGHAVLISDWDLNSQFPISCVTWGAMQLMSWSFWDYYVDEVWAVVSEDWIINNTKLCPVGLDLDHLIIDLQAA